MWHGLRLGGTPADPAESYSPNTMIRSLAAICIVLAPDVPPGTGPATTQSGTPSNSLSRAHGVFSASDVDHDGKISAAETRAMPVGPAALAKYDADGDGSWSREEFTLYYRARLRESGQAASPDLDAEVARIQALQRVRVVEEARKQGPEPASGRGEVEPVRIRFEKALCELERSAAAQKATPDDFRRLRNLVILSGRSVPESQNAPQMPAASAKMLQALDRIEKRAAAGQYAQEDFDALRTLVVPAPPGEMTGSRGTGVPGAPGQVSPSPHAGTSTDRAGPIQGPADARSRAVKPRGATRVAPKPPPQPEAGKTPAQKPVEKPPPRRS